MHQYATNPATASPQTNVYGQPNDTISSNRIEPVKIRQFQTPQKTTHNYASTLAKYGGENIMSTNKFSQPFDVNNSPVKSYTDKKMELYEQPFTNQRARQKWRQYLAKEGVVNPRNGQATGGGLMLRNMSTFERIYGPE